MKKTLLISFAFIFSLPLFAGTGWTVSNVLSKRFIENKSQFDSMVNSSHSKILYGVDWGKTKIFFTATGLTYRFDNPVKNTERKKGSPEPKYISNSDLVYLQWENASPNVQVIAEEQTSDYFSYCISKEENINYIKGYKKLIYKNIYPDIDAVYEFHETDGIKYSFILHPGADVSQIKMKYDKTFSLQERAGEGYDVHLPTKFGDLIDHAPLTFYSENKNSIISSQFVKTGNTISFSLGNYDHAKTIVIDPWVQTPAVTAPSGVWEVEVDAAGNVYAIGGGTPMQLMKYNSAGVLQWTYNTPYDTSNGDWLGALATDNNGNSYVTRGSSAAITKVNNAGGLVYSVNGGSFDEYWQIAFNCDQTKLLIGGTRVPFWPPPLGVFISAMIYDIDPSTGNVISSMYVGYSYSNGLINNPDEVRAITSSFNANYYYLTLDTLGKIDQGLGSFCPVQGPSLEINHGYDFNYKCEDYRPDNGNGPISAIVADANFLYTQNGATVHKRDLNTGAILATAAIPGGISNVVPFTNQNQAGNSGIAMDNCGNVYVGSSDRIVKYDGNLVFQSQILVPYRVSDVEINFNGEVVLCGSTGTSSSISRTGYVQSVNLSSCTPTTLVCCDANICNAGPFCLTDPPQTLVSSTSGGTWSGIGITNPATGVFDPSVSGTGTFTITYTLACGSNSIQIVVNNCVAPTICIEANGDLTVSGGGGPVYTWYVWNSGGSTPITNQAQCTACNASYTWFGGQCFNGFTPVNSCTVAAGYQQFATGTTVTPPGTWPIQVIDGNGNVVTLNSTAGLPPCSSVVNVSISQANVLCNGQCTGTATVTATNGTPPYTYNWSGGQSTSAATGLCAGTYTVLVSDAASITTTATVTITQPAALTSTATATSASCGSGGSASVNASGGTASYTYSWTGGCTTSSCTGLAAGNYTATVTDANGCTTTVTVTINTASGGTVSVTAQTILCYGDSAAAVATMNGGTSPFTYSWSGGQTTSSVNLPAGNYSVLVTDMNGCTSTQSVSITQPAAITSSVSVTNTLCGASTGAATVAVAGGSGSFTYNWNPGGQTTSGISNLGVGNYTCTITDANGCTQIQTANIINSNGPTATITAQTNATCFGSSNGTASSTASGGTSPYTYLWNTSPPQTTANATGLPAGNYTVTVTDATGCTNTQTVTITQPAVITAAITTTQASCGLNDGSASANPGGGTSPYTYTWSTFQSTFSISGLAAGNYSVIITDASGCSQTFAATVTNSNGPTAAAGTTSTIASGSSANLTASGGVTYSWNNGMTGNAISVSPTTTTEYCVYVFDASGCSDSECVTIFVLEPLPPCTDNYFLPNAFSPNGDNENDVLKIYPDDILRCISEYKLVIYDRWGEKVFESINPAETWNGAHRGRTMDTQVLVYYLHVIFTDGKIVDRQGNVTLLR